MSGGGPRSPESLGGPGYRTTVTSAGPRGNELAPALRAMVAYDGRHAAALRAAPLVVTPELDDAYVVAGLTEVRRKLACGV